MTGASAVAIRDAASRRRIRFLMHFTQAANISSIVRHGFLSRHAMSEREIDGYASARRRIDQRDDAVSVSVASFNPVMFASKRTAAAGAAWVVLLLEPSILWTHRCRYLPRNAASREVINHRGRMDGPWAFERLFSDEFRHHRFGGTDYRSETGLPDCLPTRPDAEVQVFDPVAPEAIIHAWTDRMTVGLAVQEAMNSLPGEERDVTVGEFAPRFSNGYSWWG